MRAPRLHGWKLWAWAIAAAGWTLYYLFLAPPLAGLSRTGVGGGLQLAFNWLFPIALLYLVLTIGKRR